MSLLLTAGRGQMPACPY